MPPETALVPPKTAAAKGAEERIHALDALRAAAMFLGIVLHAALAFAVALPIPGAATDVSRHWIFDLLMALIHGFRMHLFFFLSGFFARLVHERMGPKAFMAQRLKRIGIPFALGMVTLVPMTIALIVWSFVRNGETVPTVPGGQPKGIAAYPTMHLWFLEYLLVLYVLAVAGAAAGRRLPEGVGAFCDRVFDGQVGTAMRGVIFVPLTMGLLWDGQWWGEPKLPIFSWVPNPATVAHYGLFFLAGWWMHRRRRKLTELTRGLGGSFVVALAGLAVAGASLLHEQDLEDPNRNYWKMACVFGAALYSWSMTFAVTGFFLRYFSHPPKWTRYMADASYWCYLAHLPIVLALQIAMARWPVSALIKFPIILLLTMGILMGWYHWRVRHTWVGALLNGRRTREEG